MSWLLGWKYRKKITVQDAFVDSNLTNFPAYVFINADADFHEARADGYDIRFTLSDGKTLLKYEREHWSGGNGSPATAHFWVKIPSILASDGAVIYVYYGKSDAPDGEDAVNVWDANFKGIWHMKDITPSTVADSIGVNAGNKLAANEPIEADGKVYKGQLFDVLNDRIDCGKDPSLDLTSRGTISVWVKSNRSYPGGYRGIVSKVYGGQAVNTAYWIDWAGTGLSRTLRTWLSNGTNFQGVSVPNFDFGESLRHLVYAWDGSYHRLQIDGVPQPPVAQTINAQILDTEFEIGIAFAVWDGLIDEVRVSNIGRADAWSKFEHYNINEGDNELTWGVEEGILYSERLMDAYLEKKMNLSGSLEEKLNISAKTEERINLSGFLEKQLDISGKTEEALAIKGVLRKTVKGELT